MLKHCQSLDTLAIASLFRILPVLLPGDVKQSSSDRTAEQHILGNFVKKHFHMIEP